MFYCRTQDNQKDIEGSSEVYWVSSVTVTDEFVMIFSSTDITFYFRRYFGDLTTYQENKLHTNQIWIVEDLLIFAEFAIDKLTEFSKTLKRKLKTIS